MKQLFSKFLVAFPITSAVVLSWSEYFFFLSNLYILESKQFGDGLALNSKLARKMDLVTPNGDTVHLTVTYLGHGNFQVLLGDKTYRDEKVADGFFESMSILKQVDYADPVLAEKFFDYETVIDLCKTGLDAIEMS